MRKAGEEEDWKKKKTRDRGGWKRLSDAAVKKLLTKAKRGREKVLLNNLSCKTYPAAIMTMSCYNSYMYYFNFMYHN